MSDAPLPIATATAIVVAGLIAALLVWKRGLRTAQRVHLHQTETLAAQEAALAELIRAREVAEAANAAKTRYLVAVSHEIRSPLNAIYGYAQLLERDNTIPPAEAGSVIRRSAEHVTNLVEGLIDISRIESGVLKLRHDVVRLPALLDHVADMFRMQAAAKGLSFDYTIDGPLPLFVRTDEKRLRQILINLLSNAIKYTDTGGATLSVRYRSQMAVVDITDTGVGIAAEDMERIFEPFERAGSLASLSQPGIGLGLSITRLLARILGGEVTASSEAGRGSRFRLQMLLPEPMTAPAGVPVCDRVTGYRGSPKTILVIDDDISQQIIVEHLLRRLDFIVFAAASGAEGLAMARRCTPDLVLLDIQMPGCSGWEIAAQLRAVFGRSLRIVMISANAHEFRAGGDGEADHDFFLSKPTDLDALIDTIGQQLGLAWVAADAKGPAQRHAPAPLPAAAEPYLEGLRRYVKLGQVRAIETALAELEVAVPDSAGAVADMRRLLAQFDLRSLARRLDHGD
jgi:signal transduction histidine kinase/CheY-like chemotaxis protein